MIRDLPFTAHAIEYDQWFEKYPAVFQSELNAIKKAWPGGTGLKSLEIGSATGRFAQALGITEGIDPSPTMCELAEKRGVATLAGAAEDLPYENGQFDLVLMNGCISYLEKTQASFAEAFRVLKAGGCLLVGFVDKHSVIGKQYEERRQQSEFYRLAKFFAVPEVASIIKNAGFRDLEFSQTLFDTLDNITTPENPRDGYSDGSYVLIKACK